MATESLLILTANAPCSYSAPVVGLYNLFTSTLGVAFATKLTNAWRTAERKRSHKSDTRLACRVPTA